MIYLINKLLSEKKRKWKTINHCRDINYLQSYAKFLNQITGWFYVNLFLKTKPVNLKESFASKCNFEISYYSLIEQRSLLKYFLNDGCDSKIILSLISEALKAKANFLNFFNICFIRGCVKWRFKKLTTFKLILKIEIKE